MADMTYEITINIPVKMTLSSEERAEAIAYGLKRGLIRQEDIDHRTDGLANAVIEFGRSVALGLSTTELIDGVYDWLDKNDRVDLVIDADVTAQEN